MTPKYAAVAQVLVKDIQTGRYPVGSLLPNEVDLAKQLGVGRSTVRAAMRELQSSGLISRRRNAGTRVEAMGSELSEGSFSQAMTSIESIQQFGVDTKRNIETIQEIVVDEALSKELGCRAGTKWLKVSSLRVIPDHGHDRPFCWTEVYISSEMSALVLPRLRSYDEVFSNLIEEVSGRRIVEIRQDIFSTVIPREVGLRLNSEHAPVGLKIRRKYYLSPMNLIQITVTYHPSDRFYYSNVLKRV
ncbi:GntR family transcriptional regulator [Pararhizobium sp. YC-54]|uniref:GntR family transcriptional regulator n=1 Tax=Pararhizobium sp. YC-54 TaxID=2986920 RepID=UPI0021F799CB|nr:GntR family transcriptional regulator [Pararhizobium sp. YC-54]MCW0002131.1 GntR family transcriptional regulator [Pararhizobium sp. YC-54]